MTPVEAPCAVGFEGDVRGLKNLQNHAPKRLQCSFLRGQVEGLLWETGNRSHRGVYLAQPFVFIEVF